MARKYKICGNCIYDAECSSGKREQCVINEKTIAFDKLINGYRLETKTMIEINAMTKSNKVTTLYYVIWEVRDSHSQFLQEITEFEYNILLEGLKQKCQN